MMSMGSRPLLAFFVPAALLPSISRFTPSRVEVWIERISTRLVRYYLMGELPRTEAHPPGVLDRTGFPVDDGPEPFSAAPVDSPRLRSTSG